MFPHPWAFALALLTVLATAAPTLAADPPNVLVIVADDLGWRDVGYHDSDIRTPTLDRLAKAGVRLERHYVSPTCSPTRAGLLTGRNPSRFDIHGPIAGRDEASLPKDAATLARVLRDRGYDNTRVFASARSAGKEANGWTVEEATPEALSAGDVDIFNRREEF